METANELDNNNVLPKECDLPPKYDEVMQAYLNANPEMASAQGICPSHSTITIDTQLDLNATSQNDLSQQNPIRAEEGYAPPAYDSIPIAARNANSNSSQ